MAAYKDLVGQKITKVTSNPGEPKTGQMWYNSTNGKLRGLGVIAAWSSTSVMVNSLARSQGAGTTSAGLSMGGQDQPGTKLTVTEEYNGTGWSLGGSMPAAKSDHAGAGTQTAAYAAGGSPYLNSAYNYNGTSWSGIPNIGTARQKFAGCGTTTASLVFGAQVPGSPPQGGQTEEYNGSSWSEQNDLGTARAKLAGCGTQTAGLGFGGYQPTIPSQPKQKAQTEQYDGTSWSEVSDLITAVNAMGGAGTQTAAIAFGGASPPIASTITITQDWDGTSWTTSPATLSTAVNSNGGAGTSTSALSMAGYAPSATNNVEEYNKSINVITGAAWASGGNLNTARYQHAGAGSTPAGLVFGGRKETSPSANYNNSEEYDGTSWTEGNNLNTARFGLYGIGTQTAGLACGGRTTPAVVDNSEEYDGTSYTEGNNLASARHGGASAGTQTAGLIFNGTNVTAPAPGNMTTTSQSYDGTSWTATNSCNTARVVPYGFGTQTAAISVGGNPFSNSGESFDGTNWTAISGTLNDGRQQGFSGGTSTDGLVCGGNSPPNTTNVEAYNGTIFVTAPSLSTARRSIAGTPGTSVPAGIFGAGGYTSTELNSTEEFTPESTAANIADFTTS